MDRYHVDVSFISLRLYFHFFLAGWMTRNGTLVIYFCGIELLMSQSYTYPWACPAITEKT